MIEATNIKYGITQATDVIHFTGGIRGHRAIQGWNVGPVLRDGKVHEFGPVPDDHIGRVANELSVTLIGINEITFSDPFLSSQIWRPMTGHGLSGFSSADMWGAISNHARVGNDDEYANLARNVAISLRAADIRLRDASDCYHSQLLAGLLGGATVNRRFVNISLSDLHLAFHSLLAELGAARDYLSAIVAKHIKAPPKIDSLARLIDWAKKPINAHVLSHKQMVPLLEGWGADEEDRWLFDLGEYRNTFLHREPMGVNGIERGVSIFVKETHFGLIHKLRLDMAIRQNADESVEALDRFVYLYSRMQILATKIAFDAKYSYEPLNVVIKR